MSTKKLYALTDAEASQIKDRYTQYGIDEALDREEADLVLDEADRLFIPLDTDAAVERMARAHYIASARPIMSGISQKEAEEAAALQWDDMGGSDAPDEMYFHMNSMRAASNALLGND